MSRPCYVILRDASYRPTRLVSLRYDLDAEIGQDGHNRTRLDRAMTALRNAMQALRAEQRDCATGARSRHLRSGFPVASGVADKPGRYVTAIREKTAWLRARKESRCFADKAPLSPVRHAAVEIECFVDCSHKRLAAAFAAADLQGYVTVKDDGSLHGDGDSECDGSCRDSCECSTCDGSCVSCDGTSDDCSRVECDCDLSADGAECCGHSCPGGHDCPGEHDCNCECSCSPGTGTEIVICAGQRRIFSIIDKVCEVLAEHGAAVNKTCGLHVHLDMRSRKAAHSFRNLVNAQPLLYAMVPASRSRNSYCKPTKSPELRAKHGGRYHGINPEAYAKHRTLEVRLHSGTVNAMKIKQWLALLITVADARRISRPIVSLADAHALLRLNAPLLAYCRERIDKFAPEFARQGTNAHPLASFHNATAAVAA